MAGLGGSGLENNINQNDLAGDMEEHVACCLALSVSRRENE